MDFNGYMSRLLQGGLITRQREKELQRERYAWQDKRNKERREAKPAKEAEAKRIAGLSEKLVSEMQPYEVALAQRIFEGEKNAQATAIDFGNNNPNFLQKIKGEESSFGFTNGRYELRQFTENSYKMSPDGKSVDYQGGREKIKRFEERASKWITKDKEASEKLAERFLAEGRDVRQVGESGKHLIVKIGLDNYAIPITAYQQRENAPTDTEIMKSAKSTAKEVISSYATKLVSKTEDLVGKGGEFTGKPKITLSGNNPWQKSTVEQTMGGKKITWDTKMIWNISKLRNSFNQFPTRLVSQEDA